MKNKIKVRISSVSKINLLEAAKKSFYSPNIVIDWATGEIHNNKGVMKNYGVRLFKGRYQLFETIKL